MTNPCCCNQLSAGVKAIAIAQMVISGVGILASIIVAAIGVKLRIISHEGKTLFYIMTAILILLLIITIVIACVLYSGAVTRNRTKCMIWFALSIISWFLGIVGAIIILVDENKSFVEKIGYVIYSIVGLLLLAYFIYAVWCFMQELKSEQTGLNGMMPMTDQHQQQQPAFYQPAYPNVNYSQAGMMGANPAPPPAWDQYNAVPTPRPTPTPSRMQPVGPMNTDAVGTSEPISN